MLLHSPVEGVNSFYGGMLHPVAVLAHLLVLVSWGILLGQHGLPAMRRNLPALWLAFLASSWAGWLLEWEMGLSQNALLGVAFLLGIAALIARRSPGPVLSLVTIAVGLCLGYDTDTLQIPYGEEKLFLIGAGLGLAMSTTCIAGASEAAPGRNGRIGMRVMASWVVTASALAVALDWAVPAT